MNIYKQYWHKPDSWLAAIVIGSGNDQVYGKVKNDLALLNGVDPKNRFQYLDVVEIIGPIGTQMYKDDEIKVYKASKVISHSGNKTFEYEVIIANHKTYFDLLAWFGSKGQKTNVEYKQKFDSEEWLKGFCSAKNIDEAKHILHGYFAETNKFFDQFFGIKKSFNYRNLKSVK